VIQLRTLGFWQHAVETWSRTSGLPAWRAQHARFAELPITPASVLLGLFVAGLDVPRDLLPDLDELEAYVEQVGDRVRARIAILPIRGPHGGSYLVCDRADAGGIEIVCWPDDSSFHLLRSIPLGRRETWLDLGCGSAVAQLAHPHLGRRMIASDLNPRAIRYAQLGARLSSITHLETITGDLATVPADLVTCNAPIPDATGPLWTATDATFLTRVFAAAERALNPGGMFVLHAALDAIPEVSRGELVVVAYTPKGTPREFAVAWWRPDGEPRQVRARRALDATRTHVDYVDREAALAGTLSPL
jgi:SAM-dependent methyltransferase